MYNEVMIRLYKPEIEELSFKEKLLKDDKTMSYNHAYGGTIDFPRDFWQGWYDRWLNNENKDRFYRYLYEDEMDEFVGEVAWHKEEGKILIDVIVLAKYREKGYGKAGLILLMKKAKENGIVEIYDDIAIDNPSIGLFLKMGFEVIGQNEEYIEVKKVL